MSLVMNLMSVVVHKCQNPEPQTLNPFFTFILNSSYKLTMSPPLTSSAPGDAVGGVDKYIYNSLPTILGKHITQANYTTELLLHFWNQQEEEENSVMMLP